MILFILFLATILRLIKIDQSLWLDEAINVLATTQYSFFDMVTKYPIGDFHPPGYFALLWIWTYIGGTGEIWVRLPSVVFGVATVWLVYLLGKELFNKRIGIMGALFMALAPLHIYYSQEARMYSVAAFAATVSFYFFWKLIHRGDMENKVGYGISGILALYSDYLAYLIFPAQIFYLFLWQKDALKKVIFPSILSLLALVPWLVVFPKQLMSGTGAASTLPGWADVVGGAGLKELLLIPIKSFFGRVSIENKLLYSIVAGMVGLFYGGVMVQGLKKIDSQTRLLICWLMIPVALAFLISFFIPVLSYFRMIFILPAFYLLLAKGVDVLRSRPSALRLRLEEERPWRLVVAGICLVSLISLGAYYINPKFQRENWRGAVRVVDEKAQVDGLILFESNNLPPPFIYYSQNKSPAMGGFLKVPAESEMDINNFPVVKNIYFFEYLVDVTDPRRLLEKEIEKSGYKKIETLDFNGVGFVHHFRLQ